MDWTCRGMKTRRSRKAGSFLRPTPQFVYALTQPLGDLRSWPRRCKRSAMTGRNQRNSQSRWLDFPEAQKQPASSERC
jgi:hypothetical protein